MEQHVTFQYKTEANASFLVAVLGEGAEFVRYQMKMLENNHIANLLDAQKYRENETIHICYNVTSKMSLAQVMSRQKMKKEEFLTLLNCLLKSYQELPEYQLPTQGLLLDEEHIFVRSDSFEPSFVYLPVYTADEGLEGLRQFVRQTVLKSRIASTNDDFIQRILDLFNAPDRTLTELQEGVSEMLRKNEVPLVCAESLQPPQPPVFTPPVPPAPPAQPAPTAAAGGKKKKKGAGAGKGVKSGSSKQSLIFTVVQAAAVLLIAFLAKSGFFFLENGAWNVSYIGGVFLLVAGTDIVLYRELFINHKEKKQPKKKKKKAGRKEPLQPREKQADRAPEPPINPMPAASPPASYAQPIQNPIYPYQPVPADEGDDTVVDENGVFGECYLEYFENGLVMRIHLPEGVTRVGTRAQSVDYVLSSNRVSKVHAEFVRRGDRYFVRDINSTNGTYINGSKERIVSNQEIEIHPGDHIRLANMEMTFKC